MIFNVWVCSFENQAFYCWQVFVLLKVFHCQVKWSESCKVLWVHICSPCQQVLDYDMRLGNACPVKRSGVLSVSGVNADAHFLEKGNWVGRVTLGCHMKHIDLLLVGCVYIGSSFDKKVYQNRVAMVSSKVKSSEASTVIVLKRLGSVAVQELLRTGQHKVESWLVDPLL